MNRNINQYCSDSLRCAMRQDETGRNKKKVCSNVLGRSRRNESNNRSRVTAAGRRWSRFSKVKMFPVRSDFLATTVIVKRLTPKESLKREDHGKDEEQCRYFQQFFKRDYTHIFLNNSFTCILGMFLRDFHIFVK